MGEVREGTWFQRYLLPGFAFKAVVIGGGYATGRELVEFFLPHGPVGGLWAMLLTTVVWSLVCAATFCLAVVTRSFDYRAFFKTLLGPAWVVFEIAFLLLVILVLSVFGAAAGELGKTVGGLPSSVGALALGGGIAAIAALGPGAVEAVFKYVTIFLYAVYALFIGFVLTNFGGSISEAFQQPAPVGNWPLSGLQYASYNVVGAVVILPVTRYLSSRREAVVAGLLAGPLAVWPAVLFFLCMFAFYPEIADSPIPSDYMLKQLGMPWFEILFKLMIFSALIESGVGLIHSVNERWVATWPMLSQRRLQALRLGTSVLLVAFAMVIAERFGLITLVANGYGYSGLLFIAVYLLPLFTIGIWQIWKRDASAR